MLQSTNTMLSMFPFTQDAEHAVLKTNYTTLSANYTILSAENAMLIAEKGAYREIKTNLTNYINLIIQNQTEIITNNVTQGLALSNSHPLKATQPKIANTLAIYGAYIQR